MSPEPDPRRATEDQPAEGGVPLPEAPSAPLDPSSLPVFFLAAVALVLTPPLIFTVVGLAEGMGLGGTLRAMVEQYGVPRLNLFMVSVLSFLPLLFLALLVFLMGRYATVTASRRALAVGGAVAIVAVMVWVNLQFWPVFLPERSAPGFPHGLEFVIGPLYFAPVGMIVGMVVAAFAARRSP